MKENIVRGAVNRENLRELSPHPLGFFSVP